MVFLECVGALVKAKAWKGQRSVEIHGVILGRDASSRVKSFTP